MAKNADFANWMRQAQKKEWEAIPEAERPTWEQFKRGLKKKKKWVLRVDFPPKIWFNKRSYERYEQKRSENLQVQPHTAHTG